jgi:hypothetical protein
MRVANFPTPPGTSTMQHDLTGEPAWVHGQSGPPHPHDQSRCSEGSHIDRGQCAVAVDTPAGGSASLRYDRGTGRATMGRGSNARCHGDRTDPRMSRPLDSPDAAFAGRNAPGRRCRRRLHGVDRSALPDVSDRREARRPVRLTSPAGRFVIKLSYLSIIEGCRSPPIASS